MPLAPATKRTIDARDAPPTEGRDERRFAILLTALFCGLALWNVATHVLWRDEWRWWQLAEASPTFAEMRHNMRYEGAPWIWYGLVWCLARITDDVRAMQAVHVLLASATVYLFTLRAPFSRTVRLLFPFGYYAFFEYATISRNYALVFLLVTGATALVTGRRPRPIWLAVVLGLLTQASIWGVGLAGVLLLAAITQEWLQSGSFKRALLTFLVPAVVVGVGCPLCYLSVLPGPGDSFVARWPKEMSLNNRWMTTVGALWNGWVPLPRPTRHFWNTNLLDDHLNARFYLSWGLLFVAVSALARRPAALVLLLTGTAGLTAFTFFQFVGSTRHQGHLFIVLLSACWIAVRSPPRPAPRLLKRLNARLEPRLDYLLAGLLAVHAVAGVAANIADHCLPFSASREVADYLRREFPADTLIVGYDDYGLAPVSALLDRRVYSPEQEALPPFFSQDDRARREPKIDALLKLVERLRSEADRQVVIAITPRRQTDLDDWLRTHPDGVPWQQLAKFKNSTVEDEGLTLYLALPMSPDDVARGEPSAAPDQAVP
jgi:hypothetical protein